MSLSRLPSLALTQYTVKLDKLPFSVNKFGPFSRLQATAQHKSSDVTVDATPRPASVNEPNISCAKNNYDTMVGAHLAAVCDFVNHVQAVMSCFPDKIISFAKM